MRKPAVSFRAEVAERFRFLVDPYGFAGPDYRENLLPTVAYGISGLRISVFFLVDAHDHAGKRISVSVRLDIDGQVTTAELADRVEGAVFAPRHRVAWKAHTADAMRRNAR